MQCSAVCHVHSNAVKHTPIFAIRNNLLVENSHLNVYRNVDFSAAVQYVYSMQLNSLRNRGHNYLLHSHKLSVLYSRTVSLIGVCFLIFSALRVL